ncbi:MAG: phage minor capsid protein [Pseudonocardiaceae bacterium]
MAVHPEDLDAIAASVADLYRRAEYDLVQLIASYLAQDMDAPTWAAERLAAIRQLRRAAAEVVARLQAIGADAFRQAAAEAFRAGATSAVAELATSTADAAARAALRTLPGWDAIEALAAAVHRDVGDRANNILRDVDDVYRRVIASAVASGTLARQQTRRQASAAAWQRLVDQGITGFTDRANRRWQLSSYVEMAVRTVTQRAATEGHADQLRARGIDLVYVSDSVQECALCQPWEAQILRISPGPTGTITVAHTLTGQPLEVDVAATLIEARAAGLMHPNCRHSTSAYLPGVTRLPPGPTADPEGDKARQRQRALERAIRKHKMRAAAALDDATRKTEERKVRAAQAALREHLAEHPTLKRLRYREQIGAGSTPPPGGRVQPAGELPTGLPEGTDLPTQQDLPPAGGSGGKPPRPRHGSGTSG